MAELMRWAVAVGQTSLALLLAPGLVGLIRWMKARLQNRRGAPCWQPYLELRKLFGKEVVVSRNASWLFRAAPFVIFASTVAMTALVPVLAAPLPFDAVGDLVVLVYLLLLGTFFLALAGLDPGSAFGGMGASREVTVAALAEPTVALAVFALALSAGSTNLGRIVVATLADPAQAVSPGHLLAFAALFIVTLAETGTAAGGQPGHAPRAHDDPRGHAARVLGALPRPARMGGGDEAARLLRPAGQPLRARGAWPGP